MTPTEAWDLLVAVSQGWVADPKSDVVFAGEYEGRWAVRMAQQVRDFTTVWFSVGERTVSYEAYLLPNPPRNHAEVYRQCLVRSRGARRAHFAVDRDGDVFVEGKVGLEELDETVLDEVLGAVYEAVELSFRSLVRTGFSNPTRREKSL